MSKMCLFSSARLFVVILITTSSNHCNCNSNPSGIKQTMNSTHVLTNHNNNSRINNISMKPHLPHFQPYTSDAETVIGELSFSLEKFCRLLDIPPMNCSCDFTPIICEISDYEKKRKYKNGTRGTFKRSHGFTVAYVTIAVISSVFGVFGNTAVIFIAFQERKELSACKRHIAQLAVVNLIFSAIQFVNVIPLYLTNRWIYGRVMCKLTKSLLEIGSLLSSGFFQLITIER